MTLLPAINYDDIIRNLRAELLIQTRLENERILNATSVRGPELLKTINSSTSTTSPHLENTFIIFELKENQSDFYGATSTSDISMDGIIPYELNLKIYGNKCHELSQQILAQFKSPETALNLREKGVWVYGVSRAESINEFINNTVWQRCDMSIKVMTRFSVNKRVIAADTEIVTDITIIKQH